MNIAFLTTLNPYDVNSWSGTTFHVFNALKKRHNVKVIGLNMLSQTTYYSQRNFTDKSSINKYSPVLGTLCKEQISLFFNCDLIFFGDLYLAPFLEVNIPIVHFSDVTYHLFKDYLGRKDGEEYVTNMETIERGLLSDIYALYTVQSGRSKTLLITIMLIRIKFML